MAEIPSLPIFLLEMLTLTTCSAVVPERHVLTGGTVSLDWGRARILPSVPQELRLTECKDSS